MNQIGIVGAKGSRLTVTGGYFSGLTTGIQTGQNCEINLEATTFHDCGIGLNAGKFNDVSVKSTKFLNSNRKKLFYGSCSLGALIWSIKNYSNLSDMAKDIGHIVGSYL